MQVCLIAYRAYPNDLWWMLRMVETRKQAAAILRERRKEFHKICVVQCTRGTAWASLASMNAKLEKE